MANVMSLKKLRNKPTRCGFDLSRKNIFSAKVGELLPISVMEVLPGDVVNINTQHFTRTTPVNTAAYTRIREYYDWFFVPTNLLWNKFNTFVTQMTDNGQHAGSINDATPVIDKHPYMVSGDIVKYLTDLYNANSNPNKPNTNMFGFVRSELTCKLLSYLDYGYWKQNNASFTSPATNVALNPFPLLAYQKIYSDYFRNSQWERSNPSSFNVDYISGNTSDAMQIPVSDLDTSVYVENMFDLRYCNWNKDYFMGMLPNSQYGAVTTVNTANPINTSGTYIGSTSRVTELNKAYDVTSALSMINIAESLGFNTDYYDPVSGTQKQLTNLELFSILQLRQAEAKQKWAEITQSQQQDYKSQVEAHFNVSPDNSLSERCMYVGGSSSTIDITEVVNNNLSVDSEAEIKGKGIGAGQQGTKFRSEVHGYLMCIYHAMPILDYATTGIKRVNLKTTAFDYAIPEFDKAGMVQIPLIELTQSKNDKFRLVGYAPRYYDYKTDYDKVHGAFQGGSLKYWVAPFDDNYINKFLTANTPSESNRFGTLNYSFFKVNPAVVDPIFAVAANASVDSDQLLVNCNFDIKAVRSLDYDGLPY